MFAPRSTPDTPAPRSAELRRRAKRGFFAGYIHSLSARHQDDDASAAVETAQPAPERLPGG